MVENTNFLSRVLLVCVGFVIIMGFLLFSGETYAYTVTITNTSSNSDVVWTYNTSLVSVNGSIYHAAMMDNGNILYAVARGNTNYSSGAAELNPLNNTLLFSWHDPVNWAGTEGPESIYKYPNGNYLIADTDAKWIVYEMYPNNTRVWTYNSYASDARPVDIDGIDAIMLSSPACYYNATGFFYDGNFHGPYCTVAGNEILVIVRRDNRSIIWYDENFTYANDADIRTINGLRYIIVADFKAKQLIKINYSSRVHEWVYNTSGTTFGPYDAQWVDDTHVLFAEGNPKRTISIIDINNNQTVWRSSILGGTTISSRLVNSTHIIAGDNTDVIKILDFATPRITHSQTNSNNSTYLFWPILNNLTSVSINITDFATLSDPYQINISGLVGWWRFDESSGMQVQDFSEQGNNGTWNGNNTNNWTVGKFNSTGNFSPNNLGYVNVGNSNSLNMVGNLTIEAWVKIPNGYQTHGAIFDRLQWTSPNPGYAFTVSRNNNNGRLWFFDANTGWVSSTGSVNDGSWHQIAITGEGTAGTFYIDGAPSGTFTYAAPNTYAGANASIGGSNVLFNGTIDDVKVWNRSLSASEIQSHYYVHLQQLQVAAVGNGTASGNWNGTLNNPLSIPVEKNDVITGLTFSTPSNVVINGITVNDYFNTTNFSVTPLTVELPMFLGINNSIDSNGKISFNTFISGKTAIYNFGVIPFSNSVIISISNWSASGTYYKLWNESSSNASTVTNHTIGDFPANIQIVIKKNGAYWNTFISNASGYINFTYSDGYSNIQFEATPASCSDSLQNQGETGTDCGGPCSACPTTTATPSGSSGGGSIDMRTKIISVVPKDDSISKIIVNLNSKLSSPSVTVATVLSVPTSAPQEPVYQYINITKNKFNNSNIDNATIDFKVNKSWILSNNFTRIWLARYENGWNKLRTDFVNSTGATNYYRAYTNAFSYFAIIGEKAQTKAPVPVAESAKETPMQEPPQETSKEQLTPNESEKPRQSYAGYVIALLIIILGVWVARSGVLHKSEKGSIELPKSQDAPHPKTIKRKPPAKPPSKDKDLDDIQRRLVDIKKKLNEK